MRMHPFSQRGVGEKEVSVPVLSPERACWKMLSAAQGAETPLERSRGFGRAVSKGFGLRILTPGETASRLQHPADVRTGSLHPAKLGRVPLSTCWLADRRQS